MSATSKTPHPAPLVPLEELSIARLRNALDVPEGHLPAGAIGTVVHVYRDAMAYELEVHEPFHAVVTVEARDVGPCP